MKGKDDNSPNVRENKTETYKIACFLLSLGVLALLLVILNGNLLVLAPVLGLWVFVISYTTKEFGNLSQKEITQRKTQGQLTARPRKGLILAITLVVWAAFAIGLNKRIETGHVTPNDNFIAKQMSQAEQIFQAGNLQRDVFWTSHRIFSSHQREFHCHFYQQHFVALPSESA